MQANHDWYRRAHPNAARHAVKVRRNSFRTRMWRGRARHGRAGQAFELGEPGVVDGATANSSPQTAAGHDRMTRPSRRSSSRGAACGFWIRAWGQREPALQGTGRLNRSAQWLGWLKGGLDIPATHAECGSLPREHPLRTLTRLRLVTRWANRKCSIRFTSLAPLRRARCPWFLSPSNKALATAPFPSGMVGRFPEAPIS